MTYYQALKTSLENYEGIAGFLEDSGNDEDYLLQDIMETTVKNCNSSSSCKYRNTSLVNQVKQGCKRNKMRKRLRKKLEEKKKETEA